MWQLLVTPSLCCLFNWAIIFVVKSVLREKKKTVSAPKTLWKFLFFSQARWETRNNITQRWKQEHVACAMKNYARLASTHGFCFCAFNWKCAILSIIKNTRRRALAYPSFLTNQLCIAGTLSQQRKSKSKELRKDQPLKWSISTSDIPLKLLQSVFYFFSLFIWMQKY